MAVGNMQVLLWILKKIYLKTKILYYGQLEQMFQLLLGTQNMCNNHAVSVRQIKTMYGVLGNTVLFKLLNQNNSHRYNLYISTAVTMYYTINNVL